MPPAPVRAEDVRDMLGLADRARVIDLFEALMKGDIAAALKELREQYDIGADPVGGAGRPRRVHPFRHAREGRAGGRRRHLARRGRAHARPRASPPTLSMRVLSRTWQMLLKGIAEVQEAGRPIAAAEMVLVRIAYVADLPTPDEVIRSLDDGGGNGRRGRRATAAAASAGAPAPARSRPRRRASKRRAAAVRARMRRPPRRPATRWRSRRRRAGAPALAIGTLRRSWSRSPPRSATCR